MKKVLFIISLFAACFCLSPNTSLQAQTSNPWNGPRWSSVKVNETLRQWMFMTGIIPNAEGEWINEDWSYEGQAVWKIIVTWGDTFGTLGTRTLYIKNNGNIIKEE